MISLRTMCLSAALLFASGAPAVAAAASSVTAVAAAASGIPVVVTAAAAAASGFPAAATATTSSIPSGVSPAAVGDSAYTSAPDRSIYVGDIITLKIDIKNITADDLKEKFKAFEVVDLKSEPDGYRISLRTFDAGEYTVTIGGMEIVIYVASVLDDIERNDIFEFGADISGQDAALPLRAFTIASACAFLLSAGFVIYRKVAAKRTAAQNPYMRFKEKADALDPTSDLFFVDLTYYFKAYIEHTYKCRITGKTSEEIIKELTELKISGALISKIGDWLTKCDMLKFTGMRTTADAKFEHCDELLALAEELEAHAAEKRVSEAHASKANAASARKESVRKFFTRKTTAKKAAARESSNGEASNNEASTHIAATRNAPMRKASKSEASNNAASTHKEGAM